ncbi:MAG: hypothetical protein U0974_11850 [Gemmatimonadales bacterium]|nr:hypothetical protein [Gemmatimonadales bacterium]MDZ4390409.1 hypothetical protein [Gemmatimonadales bacterium]
MPSPVAGPVVSHPITIAIEHGLTAAKSLVPLWPRAALASVAAGYYGRPGYYGTVQAIFDRHDITSAERQALAEQLAAAEAGKGAADLLLVLTNEIHRGRVECTPSLWANLEIEFGAVAATTREELSDLTPAGCSERLLGAIGMALLAERLGRRLSPADLAASLCAIWPVQQQGYRDRATVHLAAGVGKTFYSHMGLLTYATPWDASEQTAHPPAPDDTSPWLLPPDYRVLGADGCWPGTVWHHRVLCRAEHATLDDLWPTLAEHLRLKTWRLKTWSLGAGAARLLAGWLVPPPMSSPIFEEVLAGLRRETRAGAMKPLVRLAEMALVSEPTRDVARVARALLRAQQRFPSLDVPLHLLLYLLPLTPGTHDLWWDIAGTYLGKGDKPHAAAFVREAITAHRMAAEADSPLFEPSDEIVAQYRAVLPESLLFVLAPTHFAAARRRARSAHLAEGAPRPVRS